MEKDSQIVMPEVSRLLQQGYIIEFTPQGTSMRPYIDGGRDTVILQKPHGNISAGDIVLAQVGARYVLHRVIRRKGNHLTLRGDGNLQGEEHCLTSDVIGKAISIIRGQGEHAREVELHRAFVWRHLPRFVRKYRLKIMAKKQK